MLPCTCDMKSKSASGSFPTLGESSTTLQETCHPKNELLKHIACSTHILVRTHSEFGAGWGALLHLWELHILALPRVLTCTFLAQSPPEHADSTRGLTHTTQPLLRLPPSLHPSSASAGSAPWSLAGRSGPASAVAQALRGAAAAASPVAFSTASCGQRPAASAAGHGGRAGLAAPGAAARGDAPWPRLRLAQVGARRPARSCGGRRWALGGVCCWGEEGVTGRGSVIPRLDVAFQPHRGAYAFRPKPLVSGFTRAALSSWHPCGSCPLCWCRTWPPWGFFIML